jgi:hypothetical protein
MPLQEQMVQEQMVQGTVGKCVEENETLLPVIACAGQQHAINVAGNKTARKLHNDTFCAATPVACAAATTRYVFDLWWVGV